MKLPDTMHAVVFDGSATPALHTVQRPSPGNHEVLLRIARAGICGTDLSILSGKHPRAQAPLILGHEIAAVVTEIGTEVAAHHPEIAAGELVTIEPIVSCGLCIACQTGVPHVCQKLRLFGIDLPGGMAEYMTVAAHRIVRAPVGMSPDMVVLAEPLAVAVHTVRLSGIRYGDTVCVIGGGPIGILTALVARETTATSILISEPEPSRRAIAEQLGFDVVNPVSHPLEEAVMNRTSGNGVDICFETAGSQAAVTTSTRILRPRGVLVQVSIPKEPRDISLVDITFKELVVKGVRVYEPFDFTHALNFLARRPELFEPLLSRPYQLNEAKTAFEAARSGNQGLRIIFRIGDA